MTGNPELSASGSRDGSRNGSIADDTAKTGRTIGCVPFFLGPSTDRAKDFRSSGYWYNVCSICQSEVTVAGLPWLVIEVAFMNQM